MNDSAIKNEEKLFWERSLKKPRGKLFGLISLFIVMVTGGGSDLWHHGYARIF